MKPETEANILVFSIPYMHNYGGGEICHICGGKYHPSCAGVKLVIINLEEKTLDIGDICPDCVNSNPDSDLLGALIPRNLWPIETYHWAKGEEVIALARAARERDEPIVSKEGNEELPF